MAAYVSPLLASVVSRPRRWLLSAEWPFRLHPISRYLDRTLCGQRLPADANVVTGVRLNTTGTQVTEATPWGLRTHLICGACRRHASFREDVASNTKVRS